MFATLIAAGLTLVGAAVAQNNTAFNITYPIYSPARPPAVPLAVRSPYTSIWSSTAGNGTLNTNSPIFWDGTAGGWEGIAVVDGIAYEYLGVASGELPSLSNLRSAQAVSVSYDSQYSNFTFHAGPINVVASFLSPVLPQDICRTSIPLSYLETSWYSTDNGTHNVQLYSHINGDWIGNNGGTLEWSLYGGQNAMNNTGNATNSSSVYTWFTQLQQQYQFSEDSDFPEWGNFTYSSSLGGAKSLSYQSGYSVNVLYDFIMRNTLNDMVDPKFRSATSQEPVFAFAHNFGGATCGSALYTIGSIQQPAIRYLNTAGIQSLEPWWMSCYGDIFDMIEFHYNDFNTSQVKAAQFETQLKADVDAYYAADGAMVYSNNTPSAPPYYGNGSQGYYHGVDQYGEQYIFDPNTDYGFLNPTNFTGVAIPDVNEAESYYSIVALSARQIMGAYVLTVQPDLNCTDSEIDKSVPFMFQKEISSDGNANTVDVMFPAMPWFLYANPELLRYNLDPLFQNQENNFYPNGYSMHDLGSNYPNATGHVEGNDEYMPVEESGNMILMAYGYYKFSGNSQYLVDHYPILKQWANYLIQFSLIPGVQVSTDDFAGALANQTNLAIKGIVGIQAMSKIAEIVGNSADAATFSATAESYFQQWEYFAIDPSGKHTLLAYDWRSSWSLLYNVFPDHLFNLGIIPEYIYEMQSNWYPTVSQVFGVPLDNRHSETKSDWQMWTAAYCEPSTRRLFVNGLAYWLNNTVTNLAFSDLYDTINEGAYPGVPSPITFIARPTVGGHFSLLAELRAGLLETSGPTENGSVFSANGTNAISESTAAYATSSAVSASVAPADFKFATLEVLNGTSLSTHYSNIPTATPTGSAATTRA